MSRPSWLPGAPNTRALDEPFGLGLTQPPAYGAERWRRRIGPVPETEPRPAVPLLPRRTPLV